MVEWLRFGFMKADILDILDDQTPNVIGELETMAVAMAVFFWSEHLNSKHVVSFVNNEGYSTSERITGICDFAAGPWFSRVPSPSNVADSPSRMKDRPLLPSRKLVSNDSTSKAFHVACESTLGHLRVGWVQWPQSWAINNNTYRHLRFLQNIEFIFYEVIIL